METKIISARTTADTSAANYTTALDGLEVVSVTKTDGKITRRDLGPLALGALGFLNKIRGSKNDITGIHGVEDPCPSPPCGPEWAT